MNAISKILKIFDTSDTVINERRSVVDLLFYTTVGNLPSSSTELLEVINSIPERDSFKMIFTSDSENSLEITNKCNVNIDFSPLFTDADSDEGILVKITIDKTIQNNIFSVYCFEKFTNDLLDLSITKLMAWFSDSLSDSEYLVFQLFDSDFSMTTSTIAFVSDKESRFSPNIFRLERLQTCKETGNFYNMSEYELIPDDFNIEGIEPDINPYRCVFDRLKTIFSAIYTASSASILENELNIQINGQRNLTCDSQLDWIQKNDYLYSIYSWVYTEGNPVDKVLIARNVMSLHCKHSDLFTLDDKTYSAIKSNYELYLRNDVEQYLNLIKEFSAFISGIVTQVGEYATTILGKFKKNLMAIGIFFLTVMIPRIGSSQGWDIIFTRDVLYLLQLILFGSIVYLIICGAELKYKMRKIRKGYDDLKENYENVLSSDEIDEILKKDELLTATINHVKKSSVIWGIIWGAMVVLGVVIIEFLTINRGLFTWLVDKIFG